MCQVYYSDIVNIDSLAWISGRIKPCAYQLYHTGTAELQMQNLPSGAQQCHLSRCCTDQSNLGINVEGFACLRVNLHIIHLTGAVTKDKMIIVEIISKHSITKCNTLASGKYLLLLKLSFLLT